jgi:hypothetical protein
MFGASLLMKPCSLGCLFFAQNTLAVRGNCLNLKVSLIP